MNQFAETLEELTKMQGLDSQYLRIFQLIGMDKDKSLNHERRMEILLSTIGAVIVNQTRTMVNLDQIRTSMETLRLVDTKVPEFKVDKTGMN